jgi:hypothetical protein
MDTLNKKYEWDESDMNDIIKCAIMGIVNSWHDSDGKFIEYFSCGLGILNNIAIHEHVYNYEIEMNNTNLENLHVVSKWYMNDIEPYKKWLKVFSGNI